MIFLSLIVLSSPVSPRTMLHSVRQFFARKKSAPRPAFVPAGERWYVIGDIHGRADLFDALIAAIESDDARRVPADTTAVLLGDLVDRGPDSAGVIRAARAWGERRKVRCLAGNHEEMFLASFEDTATLRHFLKHGGRETVLSYGMAEEDYRHMRLEDVQAELNRLVPQADRRFLEAFEDMITVGDYVLVHAGIDPARSLDDQQRSDLRWIRDRFLSHEEPLSHVVVHGHTIFQDVVDTSHRIGIDTGAFRTGRLTALVLEGDTRRVIQAVASDDGEITIEKGDHS